MQRWATEMRGWTALCTSLALVCGAWVGCADGSVVSPRDRDALTPAAESLLTEPVAWATPLVDGRILADTDRGLVVIAGPDDEGVVVGEPGELGALRAAAPVDGSTLLLGDTGVFVLRDTTFFRSPLTDVLADGESVEALVATPRLDHPEPDVWVLTGARLHLYRDARLREVSIEGVTLEAPTLGVAPRLLGRAVWLGTGGQLFEIAMDGDELVVAEVDGGVPTTAMASDGQGALWLLGEDLHALPPDRRLRRYRLGFVPSALHASVDGPDVWLEGEGGLHHLQDRAVRVVSSVPAGARLTAAADGALLAASPAGLVRYRARHRVSLRGIDPGTRIAVTTTVAIEAEAEDRITTVTAELDGEPLEVRAAPRGVVVDLERVRAGAHELQVTVAYSDGTLPATATLPFQVGVAATWSSHIRAIFQGSCARCHGPAGPAPTRLDSRQGWIDNIDSILVNVRDERMPLGGPYLDADTVASIAAWAATGFPE